MKYWMLLLAFPCAMAYGQINVRQLGATGNGKDDDYPALQKAIDSAVKTNGKVYIPRGRYRISKPLIAAQWTGKNYSVSSIEIYGDSRMWDTRNQTVILADFKDGFALGLHYHKGSIVRGIEFRGLYEMKYDLRTHYITELEKYNADPSCRDSRYSPYAGVVIDPFRHDLPPDGGYPTLKGYYRGVESRSGSTGVRVEDVTVDGFVVGIIIAPNGFTLNAEIITLQNIRIGATKVGFAGCQAQEKMNRIINVGAWGPCHTVFAWSVYGQGHPGHYYIEGVNIAGSVRQVVHRASQDWNPLFMTNVFAERIFTVGYWDGLANDGLSNAIFNFVDVKEVLAFPDYHLRANGATPSLSMTNVTMYYYGFYDRPVMLRGVFKLNNAPDRSIYAEPLHEFRFDPNRKDSKVRQVESLFVKFNDSAGNRKLRIDATGLKAGNYVFFALAGNNDIVGMGQVEKSDARGSVIQYCSPGLVNGVNYRVLLYTDPKKAKPSGGSPSGGNPKGGQER